MKIKLPRVGGIFEEFAFGREDDKSNLSIAKNRDLMSFLEQTRPSL